MPYHGMTYLSLPPMEEVLRLHIRRDKVRVPILMSEWMVDAGGGG